MVIQVHKDFINTIEEELILSNVYFHLSKKDKVRSYKEGLWVAGFFQGHQDPELAVATKKPEAEWFPVLIHEYAHFLQYKEQHPSWVAYQKQNQTEDKLSRWVMREKEYSETELDEIFSTIFNIEKDAEERTIALIQKYQLQVDVEFYLKGARAYLLFYQFVRKHRKWYRIGLEPYKNQEILKHLPGHLLDLNLDLATEQLFLNYL